MPGIQSPDPLDAEESASLIQNPGDIKNENEAGISSRHKTLGLLTTPPSTKLQMTTVGISGLLLGFGIAITLFQFLQIRPRCDINTLCVKHHQEASPILDDITIKYHTHVFNGSFIRNTIYKQDASPEVDAAWLALGVNFVGVMVSKEQATRFHMPKDWVHMPAEYGGGYVVNVQVHHHLHCLDLLRKGLYFNIDYYRRSGIGAFANRPAALKAHITHCLDSLRQLLMCNADVGVAGWRWVRNTPDSEPFMFPDFNIVRQCRNFEEIRDWTERHQVTNTPLAAVEFETPKPGDEVHVGLP